MPQSTLGYEKLFNWALAETDEAQFVKAVLEGQPEPPAYFANMKVLNRDGPADAPTAVPPVANTEQLKRALVQQRTRRGHAGLSQISPRSHAPGSLNIPRNKSFLNWAGALLPYDRDIMFIAATPRKRGGHWPKTSP